MSGPLANVVRRALCQNAAAAPGACAWALNGWQARSYSSAGPSGSEESQQQDVSSIGNAKVQQLADEIVGLSVLECSWLSEILRKKLNIEKPAFGGMPMMGAMPMMAAPGGAAAAGGGGDAAAAEEKKEQTEFAVKLEAFSAEGKIKVIKEIRAITNLGLKEAKELVEKAPVVVKSGLSKADAEAMQKQLETVGGTIKLE
ncbi:MAG: mitochondrial ribosomal protein L7/L12 [Monoraphidium minutum]|nr:MAG: mitochondrial ribosomal protein L7/L12 [Monoraphidium minutum]